MATIKEVAQAAQVSATTVSRVLNKDDSISVSAEVRMRIFQAAHSLGYVSPRQRRLSAQKKKLVIGVADWRIIRPDRPNVRLSSLACIVQMIMAFLVFKQIRHLKIAVEVGLVVGITAPTIPTGSAIFLIP